MQSATKNTKLIPRRQAAMGAKKVNRIFFFAFFATLARADQGGLCGETVLIISP
jgi:hypothetical protein